MKKNTIIKVMLMLIVIANLCILTGCGNNQNNSKQNNNTENSSESQKTYSIKDNNSFYVVLNGTKFKAGDKISSLSKINLKLKDKDLSESIPKNRYLMDKSVYTSDDKVVFRVKPLNSTDSTITTKDAVIGAFEIGDINYNKLTKETLDLNAEVAGGIKLGSSLEDVVRVFGEDYFKYEAKGDEKYNIPAYTKYSYSSGYKTYEFLVDDSGKVSRIGWTNYSYDE